MRITSMSYVHRYAEGGYKEPILHDDFQISFNKFLFYSWNHMDIVWIIQVCKTINAATFCCCACMVYVFATVT